MKMIDVESIRSELAIKTLECLEMIEYLHEPNTNSIRVVAKVKEGISEDRLILSGQSKDLRYIVYESIDKIIGGIHSQDFTIIKWITSTGMTSASNSESLSNSFSFKRSYSISAIEMLIDMEAE